MTATTTSLHQIAPTDQAGLILTPLLEQAIATNSVVSTTHTTAGTSFRIPIVVEDAIASWTNEGEEILPSDVALDELEVTPRKVAGLIPVSRELAEDSSPDAATIIGTSLSRALIHQMDAAFLGALAAPAPQGLSSLTTPELSTDLSNLDALLEAKATIGIAGGSASVILSHPNDALKLAQLKDADGSNRALVADVSTVASLPVIQTRHATEGELWIIDRGAVHVVLREDVTVTSSTDVYFSSDRVAVRATARIDFGFPYPDRLVKVTISAA
ncbi:phage major capsid protein [Nesterenkonia jeotgali]|uniref:HK97 family phage major capsid protein n=1 Tax=Nesterenkonia jeotgali TaxID=317018 RepID=A0A839FEI7_9MICC|nr:phage major capsid protein [Nesterenkonia jeotgali]MBA8920068.1 HK97 family phage major capsid protein [Nesterenkonia jeotgali]